MGVVRKWGQGSFLVLLAPVFWKPLLKIEEPPEIVVFLTMNDLDATTYQPPLPIRLNTADIDYKTAIKFIVLKLNALLAVIGADTIRNLLPFKWFFPLRTSLGLLLVVTDSGKCTSSFPFLRGYICLIKTLTRRPAATKKGRNGLNVLFANEFMNITSDSSLCGNTFRQLMVKSLSARHFPSHTIS